VAFLAMVNLASKDPSKSPIKIFSVVSGSMTPTLPVGSAIIVRSADAYFVNDVITYRLENKYVTHRVAFAGEYFLTKGDANKDLDLQPVIRDQILGKTIFSIPLLGYIQESTKSLLGLIVFIYIPTFIVIFVESKAILKEFQYLGRDRLNLQAYGSIGMSVFVLSGITFAFYTSITTAFSGTITTLAVFPSPTPTVSFSPTPSPSKSASPSPSPTISPSLSPTPSQTAQPSPSVLPSSICINQGNGAGSTNICVVNEISETIINQVNNSTIQNNVQVSNNTGGNVTSTNTSKLSVQSGSTVLTIQTSVGANSNAVNVFPYPSPTP
jgi:signal peptidase